MVTNLEGEYPEAPDVPPENVFDIQGFVNGAIDALTNRGILPKVPVGGGAPVPSVISDAQIVSMLRMLGWFGKHAPELLRDLMAGATGMLEPILEVVITVASGVLGPGMQALSQLTAAYVQQMAGTGTIDTPGGFKVPGGVAGQSNAFVFDHIMAPMLGLLTPSSPGKPGAGEANAQAIMGTIINLHLSTWMVNIVSNLTGFGVLKWINSFDDALTSAISSRGFARLATRPYLTTFVTNPATRDLNRRYPLTIGLPTQLLKRYIRGNMTQEELKAKMRELGYDDSVVEDWLLDSAKLLSTDAIVYLVNSGAWTESQAIDALAQQGYPKSLAPTVFYLARNSLVDSNMKSLANSLVTAFINHQIDNETLRYLLGKAAFTQDEVNAMVTRGAVLQEMPTRLTKAEVRGVYQEGLVDLDYVLNFLQEEGYSDADADLLALWYFTVKERRDQLRAELAERRRIAADKAAAKEQAALAAQQAELLSLG
jgi:hypothetical protein